jgi:hypothetical protein
MFPESRGTQTVDIATIPRALNSVDRYPDLRGFGNLRSGRGHRVVNFNLRHDYEGFEISGQVGIAEEGDGRQFAADAIWGKTCWITG